MFQSLFLWKVIVEDAFGGVEVSYRFVSILVFMEGHRRVDGACRNLVDASVSILVFMEGHRRVFPLCFPCFRHISFNPCFYGRSS